MLVSTFGSTLEPYFI